MDSVPLTINSSIEMFISSLDNDEKKTLIDAGEDNIALFHHHWGRDIRNLWSMWEKNTPLVNDFKKIGITHPDDMSAIIMVSAIRKINNKPVKLKEQAESFKKYWLKEIGKEMP